MQKNFYGFIKEKYPPSFKMAHDVMALKVNTANSIAAGKEFELRANEISDLAYDGLKYCIKIPQNQTELADEGINLSHCVGDYVNRVAKGESYILFLRKKQTPTESLVTLQLSGKSICQAQGQNRRGITTEERQFLENWARINDIDIRV